MMSLRFIIPAVTLVFSGSAMAADINTYRAGQTYAVVQAPNADVCAMQCGGTAQCYSWNFLRSGNPNGSGICEFNATSAAPVGHPYAVSGDNGGRSYGASNVVQGQSRTFRIGNPEAARPITAPAHNARIQAAPQRMPVANAPVIRKRIFAPSAAPARPVTQAASTQRQAMPARRQASAPKPEMTLTQQQALQIAAKQSAAHPDRRAASAPAVRARRAPMQQTQQQPRLQAASTPRRPAAMPRAPYGQPQAHLQMPPQTRSQAPAGMQNGQQNPNIRPQIHPQMQPQMPQQARPALGGYPQQSPQPQARGQQPAPAPQPNLYGSLYDVPVANGPSSGQVMTALGNRMARAKARAAEKSPTPPLYSERKTDNPNAPIATAVPVKSVETSGLEMAGPAPR